MISPYGSEGRIPGKGARRGAGYHGAGLRLGQILALRSHLGHPTTDSVAYAHAEANSVSGLAS